MKLNLGKWQYSSAALAFVLGLVLGVSWSYGLGHDEGYTAGYRAGYRQGAYSTILTAPLPTSDMKPSRGVI